MRKRFLSLLTVLALLCMLLSTTALARETDFFDAWPEDVDFSTLTCGSADAGEFYALLEELEAACVQADNGERVLELLDQADVMWDELYTECTVCLVAYYRDPTAAAEDYLAWNQLLVEAQNAYLQAEQEVLQSQYGPLVAQTAGSEAEELLAPLSPDSPEQQTLLTREQELINNYWTAMAAEYEVTWQGQTWTQAELYQAHNLSGEEAGEIQTLLDEACNAAAVSILMDMVELRNQYAQSKGYDNYAQYAYEDVYSRDYTLEDTQALYTQVKQEVVPLLRQTVLALKCNGELSDSLLMSYTAGLTQDEMMDLVEPYMEEISSEYAALFRYMRENHLADIGPLDTKLDVGFTANLPAYDSAVMFNCACGNYYDVETLTHEFGHYAEFCLSGAEGDGTCYDVAEIDSQGLELLYLTFADEMFPKAGDVYRAYVLEQMLAGVVTGCLLDEFQAAIYADGDMAAEEINTLMEELLEEYGGLDLFGTNSAYNWVEISHTFESPMYYISYATSALTSLEIFLDAQTDFDGVADTYLRLVSWGTGIGYREAVSRAGLTDFFRAGTVEELMEKLQAYLCEQVYDLPAFADLEGHWASGAVSAWAEETME